MREAALLVEKDLTVVGASAIEDKLQVRTYISVCTCIGKRVLVVVVVVVVVCVCTVCGLIKCMGVYVHDSTYFVCQYVRVGIAVRVNWFEGWRLSGE